MVARELSLALTADDTATNANTYLADISHANENSEAITQNLVTFLSRSGVPERD